MRSLYNILVRKPKGRDHAEDMRTWEDNIKMDLRKMGWEGVEWMHLAQNTDQWRALVKTVINFWVP
jgi:hypothetical protein